MQNQNTSEIDYNKYESNEIISINGMEIDKISNVDQIKKGYIIVTPGNQLTSELLGNRWVGINISEEIKERKLPLRLSDPSYGKYDLDNYLKNTKDDSITIEDIRKLTDKLPSLTGLLLEDRNNE